MMSGVENFLKIKSQTAPTIWMLYVNSQAHLTSFFFSQFSGNCSNMPKVSPVKILKEEVVERQSQPVMMGETQSDHDTDSEVDIN